MKRELAFVIAAVAVAFPAGYWMGLRQDRASFPSQTTVGATSGADAAPRSVSVDAAARPVPAKPKGEVSAPALETPPLRLSIGEIEDKLLEINRKAAGNRHAFHEGGAQWLELLTSVEPRDMPRLLAFAEKNLDRFIQGGGRQYLLGKLAETDIQGALAIASGLKNRREREQALNQISTVWAKENPTAALEWARQLPDTPFRDEALRSIVSAYGVEEPEKAFQLVLALGKSNWQRWNWVGSSLLGTLAAKDPLAATRLAEQIPRSEARGQALRNIASTWAMTDPQAALAWAETAGTASDRRDIVNAVMASWAQRDATAALECARQMPEGQTKKRALQNIVSQLASENPQSALEFVGGLPAGANRNALLGNVVNAWMQQDPDGAAAYVESLPDDVSRDRIVQSAINSLAYSNPREAIRLATLIPPGTTVFQGLASQLAGGLAQYDSQAALDWIATLPEGQAKRNALSSASWNLAQNDPFAAADFAETLPTGSGRDDFIRNLAGRWGNSDPVTALAWAEDLPDGKSVGARQSAHDRCEPVGFRKSSCR